MALEFSVVLDDSPGSLARLGGVLGDAGVNIEAIQGASREGKSLVRFLTSDAARTADALTTAGIEFTRREVLIVRILDEPGTLGDLTLIMAEAKINIDSIYVTTRGWVVLGVDDLAGAVQISAGVAVWPDIPGRRKRPC
jgi:hypothetical protein